MDDREMTLMRIAAALLGGTGAAFGMLRGLIGVAGWIYLGSLMGDFPNIVDMALIGTEAAGLLFSAAGMAGAGLLLARRRRRTGVFLMLVAAAGIAVVFAVQPFLVNAAGALGIPERLQAEPGLPPAGFLAASFAPAVALLLGAALALMAMRRRTRS